ncbi:M15 family metallopeptidase [Butyrivibrio sp. VCB2001]|uniref:M15 family metallopeptidase n=1 Tax=Butyrivibrio sp. VCB2001 TaxID=1280667 RepID=UPI000421FB97|nr:M15 family metallopeptidase [Butyrivibrio sp. VCB2001]
MKIKYLKELALLAGVIIIAAIGARFLARGETLYDYAKKNPEAAAVSSTIEEVKEPEPEPVKEPEPEVVAEPEPEVIEETQPEPEPEIIEEPEPEPEPSPERITYMDGFYYEPISNEVFKRISGISYPVDCTVSLDELRYVGLMYVDFNGEPQKGELICNKALAQDMVEIFYELYSNDYQLESVKLVDEYGGDDTASMLANNTSCFNYRVVEGTTRLSNHAYGRAIDINPFYNPYITYNKDGTTNVSPAGSEAYADRSASFPYKIDENDLAYKLFKEHGFKWGGDWNNSKDYQHFEKK